MTEFKETELDERAIKMAKVLSADAVERAGHGHPGSPVSLALSPTLCTSISSSMIRTIPIGKVATASSFWRSCFPHPVRPAVLLRLRPDSG